jgi:hypothetical protein
MKAEEFRQRLERETNLSSLLDVCLRNDKMPYVFEPKPQRWTEFCEVLNASLGVARDSIRIVGSARLGFSMKPGKDLRPFSDTSDIDVVIVDAGLFDRLWLSLLDAAYPRRPAIERFPGGWLKTRRNEIYTGWLTPADIKMDLTIFGARARPVVEFGSKWFNALKAASRYPPRRHDDVKGRLYRTWEHAELYHIDSLTQLQRTLAA